MNHCSLAHGIATNAGRWYSEKCGWNVWNREVRFLSYDFKLHVSSFEWKNCWSFGNLLQCPQTALMILKREGILPPYDCSIDLCASVKRHALASAGWVTWRVEECLSAFLIITIKVRVCFSVFILLFCTLRDMYVQMVNYCRSIPW